jgi:hypothetical protein
MNMRKTKKLPWQAFYEPEWSELKSDVTGLPVSVWVDVSGYKHKKSLNYIRFAPFIGNDKWDYNELHGSRPMLICKQPYVPTREMKCLDKSLLPIVQKWVIKNLKVLLDVGYGAISGGCFFEDKLVKHEET